MNNLHGGDWHGFESRYGVKPLDFSASVAPFGMPEPLRLAAENALKEADRYPDPYCRNLREALSRVHGVPVEQIVCGNGAADLIWTLAACLKPKQARIMMPAFGEYERALAAVGCRVDRCFLREEDDFALTEIVAGSLPEETDLLILCRPNNPTGRMERPCVTERLLEQCRENGTWILADECFLGFTEQGEKQSLTAHLKENPRMVVLKAFTKTFSCAGLRIGYALCGSAEIASKLEFFGQPWAVSVPAQAAGIAAAEVLENRHAFLQKWLKAERSRLSEGLEALGCRVICSEANFLLFYCAFENLFDDLAERGILIRSCENFAGLGRGWYRVAVRTAEDNTVLLTAMKEVLL